MYEQKYGSPFLVHDDDTNSPFDHQIVLSKLTIELGVLFYHTKTIQLVPLSETSLGEGPGFPVPDIILYNQEAEQTRVVIEVCPNRGMKNDLKRSFA